MVIFKISFFVCTLKNHTENTSFRNLAKLSCRFTHYIPIFKLLLIFKNGGITYVDKSSMQYY